MNSISNINNEGENLTLNQKKYKDIKKKKKNILIKNILLIILISILILICYLLFQIYIKKNSEIRRLRNQLDNIYFTQPKDQLLNETEKLDIIDEVYLYDKNFFRNNNMFSHEDKNRIEYNILYYTHAIEKGLKTKK